MVLRYKGDCNDFRGCVLRLRKGLNHEEAKRQMDEDSRFQRSVLQQVLAPQQAVLLGFICRVCVYREREREMALYRWL